MTTTSVMTAGELSAAQTNLPYLVGNNICENRLVAAQWRASRSWGSGTDITDPLYPTLLAGDRSAGTRTRPTSAGVTGQASVALIFDLVSGATGKYVADTFAIIGHNFNAYASCTVTIDVQIDNGNNTFNNVSTAAIWNFTSASTNKRVLEQIVGAFGTRYASIRYLRVTVDPDNFNGIPPEIGEVWIGRRRQLSYYPQIPWIERPIGKDSSVYTPDNGASIEYIKSFGAANHEFTANSGGLDSVYGINQNNELRNWRKESEGKPSLLVTNGSTDADARVHIVRSSQSFDPAQIGYVEVEHDLSFEEDAPYMESEI